METTLESIPYVDLAGQHAALKAEILEAIAKVIDHGSFILGPEVAEFERRFAELCGVAHAVGVNSGMDALILSLRAAGVGPGDEVITPPNSFVASTSCIAMTGATPVFADVSDDYLLDPQAVEAAITPRTKALLPVHLTGRACDMDALMEIASKHDLHIIEDAAQAVLAEDKGRKVGSFGIAGAFSLHPLKTLNACGDAGVVTTNDGTLAEEVRTLRNLGLKTRDDCTRWSGNSRLDTLQAAILLVKLPYLESWTQARRANARHYRNRLELNQFVRVPTERPDERAVYHTFVIRAQRRDELKRFLADRGVGSSIHYPVPIHLSAAATSLGYPAGSFPNAEAQAAEILSLPVHDGIGARQIDRVCDLIELFYA